MIPAGDIERAHGRGILEVAERFTTLKKVTASERAGACPRCGGDDRFSINTLKGVFNCRGCGAKGDVIALVQLALGSTFVEAVADLAGSAPCDWRAKPHEPVLPAGNGAAERNGRLAGDIWDAARSIRGTVAERYLAELRKCDPDLFCDIDDALRLEPRCPFGKGVFMPCLVALVRDVVTDKPVAIQRTALSPLVPKPERRSLGSTKRGAIKLWADAEITTALVVGEGLETTAYAATRPDVVDMQDGTLLTPAWALLDRMNLRDLPILAGVEALTILVDNDDTGDGQAAAAQCAQRWNAAGREVTELTPNSIGDFNDLVRSGT